MANEIQVTTALVCTNVSLKETFQPGTINVTQSVAGAYAPVVSVGTSEEDLLAGDVATLGYIAMRNLDLTNYVTWGPKSGSDMVALGRINPGETVILRLSPGITLRWIAHTGACKVQVLLLES